MCVGTVAVRCDRGESNAEHLVLHARVRQAVPGGLLLELDLYMDLMTRTPCRSSMYPEAEPDN